MNPRLRALLQAPAALGELTGAGVVTAQADNPVCGDRVHWSARLDAAGRVVELRYRATACPASCVVAELAARLVPGLRPGGPELLAAVERELAALGGLPGRERHALELLAEAWGRLR